MLMIANIIVEVMYAIYASDELTDSSFWLVVVTALQISTFHFAF